MASVSLSDTVSLPASITIAYELPPFVTRAPTTSVTATGDLNATFLSTLIAITGLSSFTSIFSTVTPGPTSTIASSGTNTTPTAKTQTHLATPTGDTTPSEKSTNPAARKALYGGLGILIVLVAATIVLCAVCRTKGRRPTEQPTTNNGSFKKKFDFNSIYSNFSASRHRNKGKDPEIADVQSSSNGDHIELQGVKGRSPGSHGCGPPAANIDTFDISAGPSKSKDAAPTPQLRTTKNHTPLTERPVIIKPRLGLLGSSHITNAQHQPFERQSRTGALHATRPRPLSNFISGAPSDQINPLPFEVEMEEYVQWIANSRGAKKEERVASSGCHDSSMTEASEGHSSSQQQHPSAGVGRASSFVRPYSENEAHSGVKNPDPRNLSSDSNPTTVERPSQHSEQPASELQPISRVVSLQLPIQGGRDEHPRND